MVEGRLRVEVLGPIRAIDASGRDVTPAGGLQRRLLALLVLRRGRVVPADVAVDVLWPSGQPRDPSGALQNHVSRLRHGLPGVAIDSIGDGYRLDGGTVDVDADRLAALVSAPVSEGLPVEEVAAVLERWRGPAFPELDDVDDARIEAIRLAEVRVRAQEVCAEHRLANGATDDLVADLSALVEGEPLRERPRSLLMSALAATGRHVEALRVYDDFRRLVGDELGIEPSPALAAQHAALLEGGVEGPSAWEPESTLPVPTTSLVGREQLTAEVAALTEGSRLVSLVGPGGVGKTRLLLEVGHLLRGADPHRPVVLCELAAANPESAATVVAGSLGIDARPGVPLAQRIAGVLGPTELVLLLDNCEHILEPIADLVASLLASCENLTIVATSRERLRVAGETVRTVPALAVDGGGSAAAQLFVDRARAVAPDFDPDDDELETVAEIARRLDGLPLAIELAAARLYTHDLHEVAHGLDHRFSLLSTGYRTAPRHESLRAAVSWSYGLLDEQLQQVFVALSVFAGPFTPVDAAAVCNLGVEVARAALSQLVERSLVMRTPDRRYVLLETLKAFGAEQLAGTGRADEVAERHARHMVEWAEEADRRLLSTGGHTIADVDAAVPELRAALDWLLEHDQVVLAGRLVTALLDFGILRLRPDVLCWSERVTAADPDDRSPVASRVWAVAGYAAWMTGDLTETGRRSARALAAAESAGGPVAAEVGAINGGLALFEGRLDDAARWYAHAIAVATDAGDDAQRRFMAATELLALAYAGDRRALARAEHLLDELGDNDPHAAYAWHCAGEADLALGDHDRARERFARAIEIAQRTDASFVTGLAGASRASIDARWGDPVAAATDFRWLIDHWRRAGMWSTQWTMLRSIAGLLWRLGHPRDAAVLVGAVSSTDAGHRIFGSDEVALRELEADLRDALGDDAYEEALDEGARLDGDAAVEHALRSL